MIVGSPTKLNLIPSGVMPVVYINQGDAGYDKEFLIYNGDSPYNVPSGVSATIRGTKADGYGVTEAATVTTGSNLVTVTITEQMVAAAGENVYELVFVDTDDLRVASINMVWAVKADALGDSTISDSDLDYATTVMNQLQSVQAFKKKLDATSNDLAAETAARIAADDTERAARIAADNTLQSNINAEAVTRLAQDNVLQAQINQLVAPSGAAPSAAEVQDARVGADGNTYPTLGGAIRAQINDLNYQTGFSDNLFNADDYENAYIAADGTVVSNTGNIASPYYDISAAEYVSIRSDVTLYVMAINEYDVNQTFIKRNSNTQISNWLYKRPDNVKYIRVVLNYNNVANPKTVLSTICPNVKTFLNKFIDLSGIEGNLEELNSLTQQGSYYAALNDFYQIGAEYRIWYNATSLPVGITVKVTDPLFDIGIALANNQIPTWGKSIYIDSSYTGKFGIRRMDRTNINTLTQDTLKSIVKAGSSLYEGNKKSNKHVHYSFDDCVFWTDLITNESTYTSAFDNAFLKDLKDIHDVTGAVFTLNCFCTSAGVSIENVPDKFAADFAANSDWLKFAFHAEDTDTQYSDDAVAAITASYNKFVTAMLHMCGTLDCIDTVTRLGYFTGTLNNCKAIRDANCGITGLLTADDNRVSYYLDTTANNYILNHAKYFDADTQLIFIKSQERLDYVADAETYCDRFLTATYGNMYKYVELFSHENSWTGTRRNIVASVLNWFKNNGYNFEYWDKVFKC